MTHPLLPNAPIVEVLLDIQIPSSGANMKAIQGLADTWTQDYPQTGNIHSGRIEVSGHRGSDGEITQQITDESTEQKGLAFRSADKSTLIQARTDGYSFHQLGDYSGWDSFSKMALQRFAEYATACSVSSARRLAIRTINMFQLPSGVIELHEYLRTSPSVSPEIGVPMSEFFLRTVFPLEESKTCILILSSKGQGTSSSEGHHFTLDIDAFHSGEIPTINSALATEFGKIRGIKNTFFFGSLTEKTIQLFQ